MKKLEVLQGGGRRGLTGDECGLRSKLEYLQSELNRPTKFKATLNELGLPGGRGGGGEGGREEEGGRGCNSKRLLEGRNDVQHTLC